MRLTIPEMACVVLVGASGSGKSTFARRHFKGTEIVSSDACRGMLGDDENDQTVTKPAFELAHKILSLRLDLGRLTVFDATNVQSSARKPLVEIARANHVIPVAIVFDLPREIAYARNAGRPDREFGPHVISRQTRDLRNALRTLRKEGFRHVHVLSSPEAVEAVEIVREPLFSDKRSETGPFDIVGDVHGCLAELEELLLALGYADGVPPEGRRAVFLGDLVDRGPDSVGVLRRVMGMVAGGAALCVPGNHDMKLARKLAGKDVQMSHGLAGTWAQLEMESDEFRREVRDFLEGLVSHYVLDGGKLVVAHAGMPERMQGRGSARVREFALYGETTGETDEFGLPVRYKWAQDYSGTALVAYGHTPVPLPDWVNGTVCLDTGCAFGGALSALRYPEREIVSVRAHTVYAEPVRPLVQAEDLDEARGLDIADVRGRMHVATRLGGTVVVPEENGAAALEIMGRFAADPRLLVYLPPTMSPSETSTEDGYLEHPREALAYFAGRGVPRVMLQEKHMGSRAVVVLGRDEAAVESRFGVPRSLGAVVTRTGRPFFDAPAVEREALSRLGAAMDSSGLWDELASDWAVLDCELMPWSAKAQALLRTQYAPLGAAASASLGAAEAAVRGAPGAEDLLARLASRRENAARYVAAYRRYCWPAASLADHRLAPFHILASEGGVHTDRDHAWHMGLVARLVAADPGFLHPTATLTLDPSDPEDAARGVAWWLELTERGGEGMVVKPLDFAPGATPAGEGRKGRGVQPAIKCRGREYLRIIYGPDYTDPENLSRLRQRGLGRKRSLATREFALGIEALERFGRREPLRRVHECVFAVLALESEPVDPRL